MRYILGRVSFFLYASRRHCHTMAQLTVSKCGQWPHICAQWSHILQENTLNRFNMCVYIRFTDTASVVHAHLRSLQLKWNISILHSIFSTYLLHTIRYCERNCYDFAVDKFPFSIGCQLFSKPNLDTQYIQTHSMLRIQLILLLFAYVSNDWNYIFGV